MNCNNTPKCKEPCGDCTQEWPVPAGAQSPAEAHAKPLAPPNLALAEALEEYWDAAWQEGREDRHHDTEDGRAQKALMAVYSAIYAAHPQPKGTAEPIGYLSEHNVPQENPYRWQFSKTLAGVYRDTALRIIPVYEPAAQAPAPAHAPGHVAWVVRKPGGYCEVGYEARVLNKLEHGTPLYTAPKSGSFMTREQAIAHCRNRRPGIQPTEQHIAATIDAYSALFGDLAPAESASPAVKAEPLTAMQARHVVGGMGWDLDPTEAEDMEMLVKAAERACAAAWGVKLADALQPPVQGSES